MCPSTSQSSSQESQDQSTSRQTPTPEVVARQNIMRVLAHSDATALEKAYEAFAYTAEWQFARRPETGLVMVRGCIGGGGAPFNLGEMSVTRAAVTLETGETGHSYTQGRNQRKAAIAAFFDAVWQNDSLKQRVEDDVIAPLNATLVAATTKTKKQVAATKVDFFTMVRGDT